MAHTTMLAGQDATMLAGQGVGGPLEVPVTGNDHQIMEDREYY